jgi:hypothetical protein
MKNIKISKIGFFILPFVLFAPVGVRAVNIAMDTGDPLYIEKLGDFTSRSFLDFGKNVQLRETASYGFSNRFSVAADVRWHSRGGGNDDGFSNIGLRGTYRAGHGSTGETDILFGFGFGGLSIVPDYSDEVYSVGVRTGKQEAGITWSVTMMTNWIFRKYDGIAYIDLTPEAYFRLRGDWSFGIGVTARKATDGIFDQEWLNAKIGKTIGFTGWFLNAGYEIEQSDFRVGASLSMLF